MLKYNSNGSQSVHNLKVISGDQPLINLRGEREHISVDYVFLRYLILVNQISPSLFMYLFFYLFELYWIKNHL